MQSKICYRKTDYYFESYNVLNIASPVTNNARNLNGPCYKKTDTLDKTHSFYILRYLETHLIILLPFLPHIATSFLS